MVQAQNPSLVMQSTAICGVTWPSSRFPVKTGVQEARTNVDFLATDISVNNDVLCLLPRNLIYSARTCEAAAG